MKKAKSRWFRVPEALWKKVEPPLPKRKKRDPSLGGRPPAPNRRALDGIFFVLRAGCRWNALNETGICSSSTAHLRFQERRKKGVFRKLWTPGLEEYEKLKGLQWRSRDGAMTKAPLGGEKNRAEPNGRSQGRRQAKLAA